MFRRYCFYACAAAVAFCMSNWHSRLQATDTVTDELLLKSDAYREHTKAPVKFKHRMHAEVLVQKYPEMFKNKCGECHHDNQGKPLSRLDYGEQIETCIACHSKPGEMPPAEKRELRDRGLSRQEIKTRELEYHAEAMHEKCRGCHRKARKEVGTRKPPITCSKCHTNE